MLTYGKHRFACSKACLRSVPSTLFEHVTHDFPSASGSHKMRNKVPHDRMWSHGHEKWTYDSELLNERSTTQRARKIFFRIRSRAHSEERIPQPNFCSPARKHSLAEMDHPRTARAVFEHHVSLLLRVRAVPVSFPFPPPLPRP